MTIGSRLTRIERALRVTGDCPPSDDDVRWAYEVSDRWVALLTQEILAEDEGTLALADEQIAFMNSEVARAQAICKRHRRACGVGPSDFEAGRRLPKHALADIETERLGAEIADRKASSASI